MPGCCTVEIPAGAVLMRERSEGWPDGGVPVVDEGADVAGGARAGAVDGEGAIVRGFLSFGGFTGAGGFSPGAGAAVEPGGNGNRLCSGRPPGGLMADGCGGVDGVPSGGFSFPASTRPASAGCAPLPSRTARLGSLRRMARICRTGRSGVNTELLSSVTNRRSLRIFSGCIFCTTGGGSFAAGIVLMTGETDALSGLVTGGGPKPTFCCLNGFPEILKSLLFP